VRIINLALCVVGGENCIGGLPRIGTDAAPTTSPTPERLPRLTRLAIRSLFTSRSRGPGGVGNASVCIIAQANALGGAEVHTLALIRVLIGRGYRIDFVSCRNRHYEDRIIANGWRDKVRIINTDLGLNDFRADSVNRWEEVLSGVEKAVLILPKAHNDQGNVEFIVLCRILFKRVFFIEHLEAEPVPSINLRNGWRSIPGAGLRWCHTRILHAVRARCADRIIAVSDQVAERLVRDCYYRAERVVSVRNGVPWREFARDEERGAAFRCRHRVPADAFVFGMIARLTYLKGIDVALNALRLLIDRGVARAVRLVVAGTGPEEGEYRALAERLGLNAHVVFVGFVDDPAEALSAYDVILFASRKEGLPLALLEGMAASCIPVVTRISGMPEAVNSDTIGRVVSPEDPEELCTALQDILALSPAEIAQMRGNAVARIRESFDIEASHRRIVDLCGLV
jgi:glycosyltransferase involved in cell wall biosynthesis